MDTPDVKKPIEVKVFLSVEENARYEAFLEPKGAKKGPYAKQVLLRDMEQRGAVSPEAMELLGRFWRWNRESRFEEYFTARASEALGERVSIDPNAYGRPDGIVIPVFIPRATVERLIAQAPSGSIHGVSHGDTTQ